MKNKKKLNKIFFKKIHIAFFLLSLIFINSEINEKNTIDSFFSFIEGELYKNDFENLNFTGWNYYDDWKIVSEKNNSFFQGINHSMIDYSPSQSWTDYTLSLKIKLTGNCHISFRKHMNREYRYLLGFNNEGCYLNKQIAKDFFNLVNSKIKLEIEKWNDIKIELKNNNIKIFINEKLAINYKDRDIPILYGGIGLESLANSKLLVDDIIVNGIITNQKKKWIKTGGPVGGLGYDVRIHPKNKKIMFVSDNPSGVNKSIDGGNTWYASNNGISVRMGSSGDNIPIFCLTVDPNNPDIAWTGTQSMRGIFKSTDCGETWIKMDNGITEWNEITFRGFTVKPGDSDVVFAAAEISTSKAGREFNCAKGKIYKTIDGGKNWKEVWSGNSLCRIIIFDPRDLNVMYVSTGIFDREAWNTVGEGILKSTNGGKTWKPINTGITNLFIGFLEMHPKNPNILICASGNNAYQDNGGIFKTIDAGKTWRKVDNEKRERFTVVTYSPSNPDIVYAGSEDAFYRSNDGGETWKKFNKKEERCWGPPGIRAGFPISAVVDPDNPKIIFVNNYGGGVFKSNDGAETWIDCSTGYTGADLHQVIVSKEDPADVYTIGRSGPFKSTNKGQKWEGLAYNNAYYPSWYDIVIHPENSNIILCSDEFNGTIIKSTDGGKIWKLVLDEYFPESPGNRHGFKSIEFALSNPQVIYAGMRMDRISTSEKRGNKSYGAYKSENGGDTWKVINNGLENTDLNINCIAIHPKNPNIVYIGTLRDGVFKTNDGGNKWEPSSTGLMSEDVRTLLIDPENSDTIFAGLGQGIGLYRSDNGGEQWKPANEGLEIECPSYLLRIGQVDIGISLEKPKRISSTDYNVTPWTQITDIVKLPKEDQIFFLSDYRMGAYLSVNGGRSWMPINDGLEFKAISSLSLAKDGSILYASTSGGGVYRLELK